VVISPRILESRMRPIVAAIRTASVPAADRRGSLTPAAGPVTPFVTISREAGAGAWSLAGRLARRLNEVQPGDPPWSSFDRELVERIAEHHHLGEQLVDSLDEASHHWLSDFWSAVAVAGKPEKPSEATVVRQVAGAILALAQVGRVIIVGRGGVFITHHMPGGVHVRLIAPLAERIRSLAQREHISEQSAASRVHQLEQNRRAFHRRYWPKQADDPSTYDITLNTAELPPESLVETIVPLVVARSGQAQRGAGAAVGDVSS
jgi:cytidylate kinase